MEEFMRQTCLFCFGDTVRKYYFNTLGQSIYICDACTERRRAGELTLEDVKERVGELREMCLMK